MGKLYIVKFSDEIVIFAENEEEARKYANTKIHKMDLNIEIDESKEMDYYPWGWDETNTPYNSNNKSISDLIKQGYAPKLKK